MKNKLSGIIIAILILVIGYQSGILNNLFSKKTIDCNSKEAISLGTKIIESKLFPKILTNYNYTIDDISFNTIITKKINKDTGAQECQATVDIVGDFEINKTSLQEVFKFFNIIFGSNYVVHLDKNKYIISSSVWYTTELTSDAEQYLINIKFDGDRAQGLYSNSFVKNIEKDFELMLPFAKKGHALIQNQIGVMYESGNGVNKNIQEALIWYEKAAKQKNPWALYNLGEIYYMGTHVGQNYTKAFEYYKESASLGNYKAQNVLANMYLDGKGTTPDLKQAIYWYEKSAEQNYHWGLTNLAHMYQQGQGVEKDLNKAISYYEKGSELNNNVAQFNLGKLYYEGKEVKQDYKKAFQYFEKSALQKNDKAQFYLGFMYLLGHGTEINIDKVKELFQLSAQQGNIDAKKGLEMMKEKGLY
jgi:TPR repeat protein